MFSTSSRDVSTLKKQMINQLGINGNSNNEEMNDENSNNEDMNDEDSIKEE